MNLLPRKWIKEIRRGQSKLPWGCPYWIDVTIWDDDGDELNAEDIREQGLTGKMLYEEYVNGELNEKHGPNHDGSSYIYNQGFTTRMPAKEDNSSVRVVVSMPPLNLSQELNFEVS